MWQSKALGEQRRKITNFLKFSSCFNWKLKDNWNR